MKDIRPVGDLIELAQDFQVECMGLDMAERIPMVEEALKILGNCAIGREEESAEYVIDTRLSFWRSDMKINGGRPITSFGSLAVHGQFYDFSYFSIGNLGQNPISTLCISLENVRILPDRDRLPIADLVYIPVLAVEQ